MVANPAQDPSSEWIVVLGAPNDPDGTLSEMAIGRCDLAIELHRDAPQSRLLLTGGFGEHFNRSTSPHHTFTRQYLIERGVSEESIWPTGIDSSNTAEDAAMARSKLEPFLPCRIRVVTSDFHLDRAQGLFEEAFAPQPVEVVGCATKVSDELRGRLLAHERDATEESVRD